MSGDPQPARRASPDQLGLAAALGGLAGAALTAHRGRRAAIAGALVGAAALATSEAVARRRQQQGEIPALWQRIASSTALAAPLGWVAGRTTGAGPVAVGTLSGAAVGTMGLRPEKVALGPVIGLTVGGGYAALGRARAREVPPAAVAATTVLAYRLVSAALFRDAQVSLLTEGAPLADLPFVVPHVASTRYVGTGYVRALAEELGGRYAEAAPDVGILGSLDELAGPELDPAAGRPARPGVLRAHHAIHPGHRAALATVGATRLPPLPDGRGPAARAGQPADEPARDPARHPQPHRHHHPRRLRGRRRPRLDPLLPGHRRAHLRRHLHDAPLG